MRPRDLLDDRQSHAGSWNMPRLGPAIETLENVLPLPMWNRRTDIADGDMHDRVDPVDRDVNLDWRHRRRIFSGVVQELPKRQPQQFAIAINADGRDPFDDTMTVETHLEPTECPVDDIGYVQPLAVHYQVAGINPKHVHGARSICALSGRCASAINP